MTQRSLWQPTSGPSSPRRSSGSDDDDGSGRRGRRTTKDILFMLSGEATGIPQAEARTLVRDLDPSARFETPEAGLLVAETCAEPAAIESRVAFSRRVGVLVPDGELDDGHLSLLRRGTFRVRIFGERDGAERRRGGGEEERERALVSSIAGKVMGRVSLDEPDHEVSAYIGVNGARTYLSITAPRSMRQGWAKRRPRSRAFFHPSAIFPKLSRALVNFSGVQPGEMFLDPFSGTGSLLIEASIVGAEPLGVDLARKMVRGARRNSIKYGQDWLGVVRADARKLPLRQVSAVATDIPYGRASSAGGVASREILEAVVEEASRVLPARRKLVVMHPKSIGVEPGQRRLLVEEELDIYVHRMLTRTITIMRMIG